MNKDTKQQNNNKLIRSNPWGFGIHSPYVYKLVTKVIFDKKPFFIPLPLMNHKNEKTERWNMISRIISFLNPDKIAMVKRGVPESAEFDRFTQKIHWIGFPELSEIREDFQYPMVIWQDAPEITGIFFLEQKEACWILINCKELKMKEFMNYLRNSEKVSLTIEVNNTGIVIFNDNFQKQNYVICGSF